MANQPKNTVEPDELEIAITRQFNAPRDKVWQAWTEPEKIEKWFGPRGFTTRVDELDFKPGGKFTYVMLDIDGNEFPSVGVFKEIVQPERIVATDEFGDLPEDLETPETDLHTGVINTPTFEDTGDKTNITISIVHQSVEDREKHEKMGVVEGFNQQLDKLAEYLQ